MGIHCNSDGFLFFFLEKDAKYLSWLVKKLLHFTIILKCFA